MMMTWMNQVRDCLELPWLWYIGNRKAVIYYPGKTGDVMIAEIHVLDEEAELELWLCVTGGTLKFSSVSPALTASTIESLVNAQIAIVQ